MKRLENLHRALTFDWENWHAIDGFGCYSLTVFTSLSLIFWFLGSMHVRLKSWVVDTCHLLHLVGSMKKDIEIQQMLKLGNQ